MPNLTIRDISADALAAINTLASDAGLSQRNYMAKLIEAHLDEAGYTITISLAEVGKSKLDAEGRKERAQKARAARTAKRKAQSTGDANGSPHSGQ